MSLCNRLIGGAIGALADAVDTIASFWQTPREVEWAKAAADGLAEREAEEEVAAPIGESCFGYKGLPLPNLCGGFGVETSATTPGAVDGPAEGEPPEPSAGVGTVCIVCFRPSGNCDCVERLFGPFPARSAAVESPASVPAAECSAPEFDWVTTAIPVIAGVLAEHVPSPVGVPPRTVFCGNADRVTFCAEFADMQDWRNHVSPIIAAALQTPRSATVYDFASGDRPRPLADFPKHQK